MEKYFSASLHLKYLLQDKDKRLDILQEQHFHFLSSFIPNGLDICVNPI